MPSSYAIGVDIGATKIALALIDRAGQALAVRHIATEAAAEFEAVVDRIGTEIEALPEVAPGIVAGIGVGCPGQVNPRKGTVRDAVNLGWQAVPLADRLRARLRTSRPIWLQTDTNAGALGEYFFGAARSCPNFVYLAIGSGLGAGAIANGQLITGATDSASEWGHLAIDPINGQLCSCGLRGCAETVVSGPGLLAVTRQLLKSSPDRAGWPERSDVTTGAVIEAARAGDPIGCAAFDRVGEWLGIVMAACVAALNPAQFVIGGGLGLAAFEELVPAAKRELRRRVLPKGHAHVTIVRSQVKSSAIGAACLVWSDQRSVAEGGR